MPLQLPQLHLYARLHCVIAYCLALDHYIPHPLREFGFVKYYQTGAFDQCAGELMRGAPFPGTESVRGLAGSKPNPLRICGMRLYPTFSSFFSERGMVTSQAQCLCHLAACHLNICCRVNVFTWTGQGTNQEDLEEDGGPKTVIERLVTLTCA